MAGIYEYSLIRAVPDTRRGEWVNIGLVVYLSGSLDVRLLGNLGKLRVLAPTLDLSFVGTLAEGWNRLCAQTQSAQDRQVVLSQFPLVHASSLAQFVADGNTYETQLQAILRDLVMPPTAPRADAPTRLETTLRGHFRTSKLLGAHTKDIDRHLVVPRFPIESASGLYADFALRNGAMRVTQTIDFRVSPEQIRGAKRGQAALKAVALNRAMQVFMGHCSPSVVYAANDETADLTQPSLTLLADYAERLYDAGNPQDLADYMSMMHAAAQSA